MGHKAHGPVPSRRAAGQLAEALGLASLTQAERQRRHTRDGDRYSQNLLRIQHHERNRRNVGILADLLCGG